MIMAVHSSHGSMHVTCTLLTLLACLALVGSEADADADADADAGADADPIDPAYLLAPLSLGCKKAVDLKYPRDDVTFWLYTRENTNGTRLDQFALDSLKSAPFAPGPVKVLIHGYTVNRDTAIMADLRPAYLAHGDYNLVAVDWSPLCPAPCYYQAVQNVPTVALCVADFLNYLERSGRVPDIHLLGHSLGAHVAFQASRNITRVKRITGLDVAYPLYHDDSKYLVKGKAEFIDVYHSNCGIKGRISPDGDLDVYFNDGVFMPGCPCEFLVSPCSHDGCVNYFIESISSPERMMAFPCGGWKDYKKGKCPVPTREQLVRVGERVDTTRRGKYMMFTNAAPPYLLDPDVYTKNSTFMSFKDTADSECSYHYDLLDIVQNWG